MNSLADVRLKNDNDFLRRQHGAMLRRQKKLKAVKVKGIHLLIMAVIIGGIGYAAYRLAYFILHWHEFNIKSYRVINGPIYDNKKMAQILNRYQGNIFSISLQPIKRDLLAIPEVKDVSLSRRLPSEVEVKFTLRQPCFQVQDKNGYNILDEEGVVIRSQAECQNDLIRLEQIPAKNLSMVLPLLKELIQIKSMLEYVTYLEPYGIGLKITGIEEMIYPGQESFQHKISNYLKLRQQPIFEKDRILKVDCRFTDRIYLEYREVDTKDEE